ncbi:McrC family protein [Gordonia aurantiaca]|uniref:McrC family protein n=1 Tax=Gordonia sp. B21 TaxID=3151852 RepID=UPI003267D1FA
MSYLTPILLTEGDPPRPVSLDFAEYELLRRLAIVEVNPSLQGGVFEVSAGRKIGAVAVGERQIVVRPKISDLNRLVFLLGYSLHRDFWLDDEVHLTEADELLPAMAEAFGRLASHATAQGLLQGYRTTTDDLPVLRGRMLASEQMTRHHGLPVPIAVEYDEFTVDIGENQQLLAATLRLLGVPGLPHGTRSRLQRLRRVLVDVTPPIRGLGGARWRPTRLNKRYHSALRLADLVLAAQSFEHRAGDLPVSGFMFDMWRIFEDFVSTSLGEALTSRGGQYATQKPVHLDTERSLRMRPDLVWTDRGGAIRAVVDAKYKAERPEGFPFADLYELLAYCTVLGLRHGHLVYAKGNEPVRQHVVEGADVTLHCHALDLSLPPAALLGQVEVLADSIAAQADV